MGVNIIESINKEVEIAKKKFAEIKLALPNLNAYLVWSSNQGQCKLTSDMKEIFKEFPEFYFKDENFNKAIVLQQLLLNLEKEEKSTGRKIDNLKGKSVEQHKSDLDELIFKLIPNDNIYIEFRFEEINYDIIRELKNHRLVQQPIDMMRDAYIRVILSKALK